MKARVTFAVAFLSLIAWSVPSVAAPTVLNATDSGWYNPTMLGHIAEIKNYAIGPDDTFRNFFVFDLSALTETYTKATLRLEGPPGHGSGTANYEIYDVTTAIPTLRSSVGLGAVADAIHADLGSGVFYGSGIVTPGATVFEFDLNFNALAAINGAISGPWALGGRNAVSNSYAFYNSDSLTWVRQLVLDTQPIGIAEPSTLALLGLGLAALAGTRRRKQ
jgi:hypothetical protein